MSRLIRNGCNITGQKMIWSVKCILSCPTRSNFNKSYLFYRQIGFKIFQICQLNESNLLLTPLSIKYNLFLAFFIHLIWLALWTSFSILVPTLSFFETSSDLFFLVKNRNDGSCKKKNFFKVKYWRKGCFFWY